MHSAHAGDNGSTDDQTELRQRPSKSAAATARRQGTVLHATVPKLPQLR
jgi:hypothetical protein